MAIKLVVNNKSKELLDTNKSKWILNELLEIYEASLSDMDTDGDIPENLKKFITTVKRDTGSEGERKVSVVLTKPDPLKLLRLIGDHQEVRAFTEIADDSSISSMADRIRRGIERVDGLEMSS